MKSFFGQKNYKCSTSPIELTGSNHVNASGPKNLRSANMKVHTHFANKNYFGFPKKKHWNSHQNQNGRCSKISQNIVFLLVFSLFPKTSPNGNRSTVRRGKTSGETPNISQVRKSIQSLLGEMDGFWKLDGNDPFTASFFGGMVYIFRSKMCVKLPGIGIIKLIVGMFFQLMMIFW